jgi:hypothetical protein
MLQRTAGFGMISKMLPVWRAYPAHAGQPMAAAPRGVRPSPDFLPKRGRIHARFFAVPVCTTFQRRRGRLQSSA